MDDRNGTAKCILIKFLADVPEYICEKKTTKFRQKILSNSGVIHP